MTIPHRTTPAPLRHATATLARVRRTLFLATLVPLPVVAVATLSMIAVNVFVFQNAFLALFLGIIFVVFAAGQLVAFRQLRAMRGPLASAEKTIKAMIEAGAEPDLAALRDRLDHEVPEGPLRDLVLRWTELGVAGRTDGYEMLLEDELDRRAIEDTRLLGLHATINRTTLKLGFLGTLIGIILTFPPMKRAVLGLSDSDGELKFIRDIALAIDGDQYAILSTLIATGLSILVEFVTIQTMERILHGFDIVQSGVNDWNAMCLQPAVTRKGRDADLEVGGARMELALAKAQQTMEAHLAGVTDAMREAARQLAQVTEIQAAVAGKLEELAAYDRLITAMSQSQLSLERNLAGLDDAVRASSSQVSQVADTQAKLGRRVEELSEYERQYRAFLAAKQKAAAPDTLRGDR
jgi:biopolymer transport protein ExbB/TolQ